MNLSNARSAGGGQAAKFNQDQIEIGIRVEALKAKASTTLEWNRPEYVSRRPLR